MVASSLLGFVAVLFNFWWPDTVFQWLLNMVGAATLVVWGFISVAQLVTRYRLERTAPERLVVRMWLFPALTVVALLGILGVLLLMLREGETRTQLAFTGALTVALALIGLLRQRLARRESDRPEDSPRDA